MIAQFFAELGPWSWVVLGLVLLTLEIVAPGVFLLWIGIAAVIVGLLSLAFWGAAFWGWQVQVLLFLALSLVTVYVGRKYVYARTAPSDQPLLNRRSQQLVGRTATLTAPIENGRGRIKLGDTLWRVKGPDLATGATVRVVGVSDTDMELVVEAVL